MSPQSVSDPGLDMASADVAAMTPPVADAQERSRERWVRVVLLGLIVLVLGFTATLTANFFYPCVPAAGSLVQPPLADCAVFLSPWIGLAVAGLVILGVGYLRAA